MNRLLQRLRRCERGSVLEFAFVFPSAIILIFGVVQVGLLMQAYNAMRSVMGDVSRYAIVRYMASDQQSDTQLTTKLIGVATSLPYALDDDQIDTATAVTDATNTLSGVKKIDFTLVYDVSGIVPYVNQGTYSLSISKSVYVRI